MRPLLSRLGLPGLTLTAAVALVLGHASDLPDAEGLLLAVASVALATVLRVGPWARGREVAIAPALAALFVLAATTPLSAAAELLAGSGGIAALV